MRPSSYLARIRAISPAEAEKRICDRCRLPSGQGADSVLDETRGTVLLALAANVGVAVIKLAAGLLTGFPAVLSEAAHSVADTMNEVFLLVSLRRSERPADHAHPFGYGRAVLLRVDRRDGDLPLGSSVFRLPRNIGVAIQRTAKQPSLVIAARLGYVAVILGRDTKELLIGESADPVVRATAFATITSRPEITGVKEILTMQLGQASVLVAARVQFEDDLNAKRVQLVCTDIEAEMLERMPELTKVFLDPARSPPTICTARGNASARYSTTLTS